MDPGTSVLATFGFLGIMGAVITRMFFKFEERKLQLRSQNQATGNDSLRGDLEDLRVELARLRDTSTQYDISIQHTLEDMQGRLEKLESRRTAAPAQDAEEANIAINRQA